MSKLFINDSDDSAHDVVEQICKNNVIINDMTKCDVMFDNELELLRSVMWITID